MTIELDHVIVSARDQRASARRLAGLLGVSWAETGAGPFSPVYVNDGLTLDFIDDDGPFPVQHFCFWVDEEAFDSILAPYQGRRNQVSQHRTRSRGHAGQHAIRRPYRLLERARRPPTGDAHGELCAAGQVTRRRLPGLADEGRRIETAAPASPRGPRRRLHPRTSQ